MPERHKALDYRPDNVEFVASADAPMAHWLLRFALSATFLFHGLGKIGNMAATAEHFGLSQRVLSAVTVVELIVPALLVLGGLLTGSLGDLATRLAGICAIAILLGAISVVHWGQWSFAPSDTHPLGGMEYQVTLIAVSLFFVFRGNSA